MALYITDSNPSDIQDASFAVKLLTLL